jgi:hypothetical protein
MGRTGFALLHHRLIVAGVWKSSQGSAVVGWRYRRATGLTVQRCPGRLHGLKTAVAVGRSCLAASFETVGALQAGKSASGHQVVSVLRGCDASPFVFPSTRERTRGHL